MLVRANKGPVLLHNTHFVLAAILAMLCAETVAANECVRALDSMACCSVATLCSSRGN